MSVDRTPHNLIPRAWIDDPEIRAFIFHLLGTTDGTRIRTGGDFDQVVENSLIPRPQPTEDTQPLPSVTPPIPPEPDPEPLVNIPGAAIGKLADDLEERLALLEDFLYGTVQIHRGSVASIKPGWQLADGTNGTPDLRDRFILGAGGTYSVGDADGGLIQATVSAPSATTEVQSGTGATVASSDHTHTVTVDPDIPDYYALAFIARPT